VLALILLQWQVTILLAWPPGGTHQFDYSEEGVASMGATRGGLRVPFTVVAAASQ